LKGAVELLHARAVHAGPTEVPHVRAAADGRRSFLWLGDKAGTVIETGPDGWRPCDRPPVRFLSVGKQRELPHPQPGGRADELREFVNLDDDQFALVLAWLVAALRGRGPFPVLVLTGEQGSAKTTAARVLKRLVDPTAGKETGELTAAPKESRDLAVQTRSRHVLGFDNLSGVPDWLSDDLCRLATGGAFATRALHTDDDEKVFEAMRPVVLTGIADLATEGDLLSRSFLIRVPPIPPDRRRAEEQFWTAFDAARPRLLGALLDRLAGALRALDRVPSGDLPRLADAYRLAVAAEIGTGGTGAVFRAAFDGNRADADGQALDGSPLPPVLTRFMADRDRWEGAPAELLAELTKLAGDRPPAGWPKHPNALSGQLRRLAPALRSPACGGLSVVTGLRTGGGGRAVRLTRPTGSHRDSSTQPPQAPHRPDGQGVPRPPGIVTDRHGPTLPAAETPCETAICVDGGACVDESRTFPGADPAADAPVIVPADSGRLFPNPGLRGLPD
jgi:hypothetical protein